MTRNRLALVFAVALGVRLLFSIPVFIAPERAVTTFSDSAGYDQLARNLLAGHGFSRDVMPPYAPDSFRTPLYPLFVALCYLLFGSYPLAVVIIQAVLAGGCALLAARLGTRLAGSPSLGLAAGFIAGLAPNLVFVSSVLMAETLFTLLLLASFTLVVTESRPGPLALGGLLAGLAALCRPVGLLLVILYGIFLVALHRRAGAVLACVLVFAATVAPWFVRNYVVFRRVTFATVADVNIGQYWAATLDAERYHIGVPAAQTEIWREVGLRLGTDRLDTVNMARLHGTLGAVGIEHIARDPLGYARLHLASAGLALLLPTQLGSVNVYFAGVQRGAPLIAQEFLARFTRGRFMSAFRYAIEERVMTAPVAALTFYGGSVIGYILLLVAAALSPAQRKLPIAVSVLCWVIIAYFVLASGPAGGPRLRAPTDPLLALLAAAFLTKSLPARR